MPSPAITGPGLTERIEQIGNFFNFRGARARGLLAYQQGREGRVRDGGARFADSHRMHILILGNDPKTLVNFRGPLIEAMLAAGHRVTAAGCGRDAGLELFGHTSRPVRAASANLRT